METHNEVVIEEQTTDSLRRLIEVCDRFESQWSANSHSIFDEFLEAIPPQERSSALRELLHIDLELRRRVGQKPQPIDYESISATYSNLIREVFAESVGNATLPNVPGHEILDRLGVGGMGMVYRARHVATGRIVAVKMIRMDLAEWISPADRKELTQRFEDEARAVATLDHPGIVPLFEVGQASGWGYFTMRYMEGGCLSDVVKNGIDWARAAQLMADIAKAVQYAHDNGVLHRDIKPANILLDKEGRPKIGDFGLAKLASGTAVFSRSMPGIGTPGYMPPEQALGRDITARSDVYSLGATLFELLTGLQPAKMESTKALSNHLQSTPPPLRAICLQCLQENPTDRYSSAGEVADDLTRLLAGRSVRALPDGWRGTLRRAAKKPSVRIGAIALCTILLASLGIWFGYARPKLIKEAFRSRLDLVLQKLAVAKTAAPLFELEELCREIPPSSPDLREVAEANLASWASLVPQVEFMADSPRKISASAASPNGNRFAVGTETGAIFVFDKASNSTRTKTNAHNGGVKAIVWSPDGESFASGGENDRVQVWSLKGNSIEPLAQLPISVSTLSLAFVHGGAKLLVGAINGQYKGLSLWNSQDGTLVSPYGDEGVVSIEVSSLGNRMIVKRSSGSSELWDSGTFKLIFLLPKGIEKRCFTRNGSTLATSGGGSQFFSAVTGLPLQNSLSDKINLRFALFVGAIGESGLVWRDNSGETYLSYESPQSLERLLMPREFKERFASSGGNYVWFTDHESILALRMPSSSQHLVTPEDLRITTIDRLDADRIVGLTLREKLHPDAPWGAAIWDATDPSKPPTFPELPPDTTVVSAVACDELQVVMSSRSPSGSWIHILDSKTLVERFVFPTPSGVSALAILSDGKFAVACNDNRICLFDSKGSMLDEAELRFTATRLKVDPASGRIAAIDRQSNIAVIKVKPELSVLWRLTGPRVTTGLAFTSDGSSLLALSASRAAMAFRVADGVSVDTVPDLANSAGFDISQAAALAPQFRRALFVGKNGSQTWSTAVNLPIGPLMQIESVTGATFLSEHQVAMIAANQVFLPRTLKLPLAANRRQWLSSITASNYGSPLTATEWRASGPLAKD